MNITTNHTQGLLASITVLIFFALAQIMLWLAGKSLLLSELLIVACILLPALLPKSKPTLPGYIDTLTKGLSLVIFTYIFFQYPLFPQINTSLLSNHIFLLLAWLVSLATTIASYRNANLLIAPSLYLMLIKVYASNTTGVTYRTTLDITPLFQISLFVAIITLVSTIFNRLFHRDNSLNIFFKYSFFCVISFHMAGYFFSGIEKLSLDGGFLSWPLKNEIQNIFYIALHNKQLFWTNSDFLFEFIHWLTNSANRYIALTIFVAQLLSLLAFFSKKCFIVLLIIYDLMHLGIFVIVGANFMTWFFVNLALLYAIKQSPREMFGTKPAIIAVFLMCFCQFGYSKFYRVPNLGWYDSLATNRIQFSVKEKNGTTTEIPPNYFLFYSYPFGHMSFGHPDGRFMPTSTNGGTDHWTVLQKANTCTFSEEELVSSYPWKLETEALGAYLQRYHEQIEVMPDSLFSLLRIFYWHHFWPSPTSLLELSNIDISNVEHYILEIEATCLQPRDKLYTVDVVSTTRLEFSL